MVSIKLCRVYADLELEMYDKMLKDLVNGTIPESFFAQVKIVIFRRVLHFHFASKIIPGTFQKPMEFAAKRRFIPVDPEVTPTKYVATFVQMQLSDPSDGLSNLPDICTEDGTFKNQKHKLQWRRATFCLKRKQLRYGIVQRVKKELYSKKARATSLSQSIMSPVHPSIDLNGTWSRVEVSFLQRLKVMARCYECETFYILLVELGKHDDVYHEELEHVLWDVACEASGGYVLASKTDHFAEEPVYPRGEENADRLEHSLPFRWQFSSL